MKKNDCSLYLVTDSDLAKGRSLIRIIEEAVRGGVSMVQLREKTLSTREFFEQAKAIKEALSSKNIPLIINDRVDIALAVNAEGLHIGQSDMPYKTARELLGLNKIIGLSVENLNQVEEANLLDVDYIGISPVFVTDTKMDIAKPFELTGVKKVSEITKHPTVGIGGINKSNAFDVIRNGANGIAVVSAIISHDDPRKSAEELKSLILEAKR